MAEIELEQALEVMVAQSSPSGVRYAGADCDAFTFGRPTGDIKFFPGRVGREAVQSVAAVLGQVTIFGRQIDHEDEKPTVRDYRTHWVDARAAVTMADGG
jgi:hypothetical protein